VPSADHTYRIRGLRVNRREVLRYAVVAGVGLVAIPLIGCGGEDEAKERKTSTPVATAVPPSGFFDSDGVKIHYETFGEGYPIVLVHGITGNLKVNWVDQGWAETLQPIRRVVALDCRGHGRSDKPHDLGAYAGDKMPQDILNLMDYLGIEKADLFGYSMGAFISLDLLAHHSERFTSVILGGIGKGFTFDSPEQIRAISDALLAEDPSTITDPWGKGFRDATGMLPDNDLEALAACIFHLGEPIDLPALAAVDIPVLIVDGADDILVREPEDLKTAIPGADLVTIAGRDHATVVADPRFKEAVLAFLERE
jgi:pimeloyl-ACP methyl ester carboxylesterase